MSATTGLVILQAAAAPSSTKTASELGLSSDKPSPGGFADTLKAELTSGQANDKNGKSLPQGGEKSPNTSSETDSAEPPLTHMTSGTSGGEKKASLAQVAPGTTDPSNPSTDDISDARHAGALSQPQADSDEDSLSQTVTAVGVTDQRIAARLDALQQLFRGVQPDAIAGDIDLELLQSLARSDMPLSDVMHQLRQMADAGVRQFDIATFNQGLTAGPSNRLVSSQPSMPLPTAERGQGVTIGVTQPGQSQRQPNANGFEALAFDPAQENDVIDRSQRLEAIRQMVSQTGNAGVSGTLSAELQRELANSDEPLSSVKARLQALSSSGVTEFDKALYFAHKAYSVLASPVGGNPAATTVTASTVGQETTPRSASAGTLDAGLASAEALTADSRRTATSVITGQMATSGASQKVASQNYEGTDSLDLTDLRSRQNALPRQTAGEQSILNPERASSTVPMTAQMTALDETRNESQRGQPSLLGALGPAAQAGDAETSTQLSAHRSRMALSVNGQQPTTAKPIASDPSISLQAMTQEQPTEGRMTSETHGARSLSFELPPQSVNASTASAQASPAAAATSAPNAGTSTPLLRAGSEHVMQTQPWTPQFSEELSQQVRVFVNNGLQEARLQLTPADLCKVQITINMEGDHARVAFVAETAVARDLLDQSMPRLREMLQQSGIQLAQGDVNDQAESQRREGRTGGDAEALAQNGPENASGSEEQRFDPARGEVSDSGRVDTYI